MSSNTGAKTEGETLAASLNERVYQEIKSEITTGRLRPGNKLGHAEIASSLSVSRTPVREALERLFQEGYVSRIQNRGYFVAEIDNNRARELYQAREALECHALRLSMQRGVTRGEHDRLMELARGHEALFVERRIFERGKADLAFHRALAELSGNSYIVQLNESIFEQLLLKRRLEGYHYDRGTEVAKEHYQLLLLIENGDVDGAVDLLRDHIRRAWAAFEQYLTETQRQ